MCVARAQVRSRWLDTARLYEAGLSAREIAAELGVGHLMG